MAQKRFTEEDSKLRILLAVRKKLKVFEEVRIGVIFSMEEFGNVHGQ
jgi:hypothetical protein